MTQTQLFVLELSLVGKGHSCEFAGCVIDELFHGELNTEAQTSQNELRLALEEKLGKLNTPRTSGSLYSMD